MAHQKREQGLQIIYITKILNECEFIFELCSFNKVSTALSFELLIFKSFSWFPRFLLLLRKIFRKINISYPLTRTRYFFREFCVRTNWMTPIKNT